MGNASDRVSGAVIYDLSELQLETNGEESSYCLPLYLLPVAQTEGAGYVHVSIDLDKRSKK